MKKLKYIILILTLLFTISCTSTNNPTPDGSSLETAIIINAENETIGVDAEYQWLETNYPNYKVTKQTLVSKDNKPFDYFEIETAKGESKEIYFDISSFFGKF